MASDYQFMTETGSLAVLFELTSWIPLKEAEESFSYFQSILNTFHEILYSSNQLYIEQ